MVASSNRRAVMEVNRKKNLISPSFETEQDGNQIEATYIYI